MSILQPDANRGCEWRANPAAYVVTADSDHRVVGAEPTNELSSMNTFLSENRLKLAKSLQKLTGFGSDNGARDHRFGWQAVRISASVKFLKSPLPPASVSHFGPSSGSDSPRDRIFFRMSP
jgi:hypothetical protein